MLSQLAPATTRIHPLATAPEAGWTVIDGLPGAWRRIRSRVAVSARASDGISVDGRLVDGLQILRSDADGEPSQIRVGQAHLEVLAGATPFLRVTHLPA
jgi:hypothetical protein